MSAITINKIIYEWLNDSNNKELQSTIASSYTLNDCILVLSINDIIISYDSIIEYHNKVIQHNKSTTSIFNGLNQQQFQILNNNIKSLNNIYNSNNKSETITITPSFSDDQNKIKFYCLLYLINQNNNKTIINQQQNNGSGSGGGSDNDIIFFRIWRNVVIRNEILKHTSLFNIHYGIFISFKYDEIKNYKYNGYLNKLEIKDTGEEQLIITPNSIPSNITELSFCQCKLQFEGHSIPSSVTSLSFSNCEFTNQFVKGILHDSIVGLDFKYCYSPQFNQSFQGDWLPSKLETLSLGIGYDQSIKCGQLPKTLLELNFYEGEYDGVIEPNAIPIGLKGNNSLFYTLIDDEQIAEIPKSTTCLEYDSYPSLEIKQGDIPQNVISMKANCSTIEAGSLPSGLKELTLLGSMETINEGVLPEGLTYISTGLFNGPLLPNIFPQSIETIKFGYCFYQSIPEGYFYNFNHLTTIEFGDFIQDILKLSLPQSLTSLYLGRISIDSLNFEILPLSLKKLQCYCIDVNLEPGKLPPSIEILHLTRAPDSIKPNVLPNSLKELHVDENLVKFLIDQDLTLNNLLPPMLKNIYIPQNKIDYYLNNLDLNFIIKYIRPPK